ncbi:MAG: dihydroneopterin aldolase [Actinobacteria bacterium]|nr:dihydroneopterin aldolase [Actinomycetota bacterium]
MTDFITISGLRVRGFHGVLESERRDGQYFIIDAVLGVDIARAAATDDLAATVDYSLVSEMIHSIVSGEPVQLIETLAENCATACLDVDGVTSVTIVVHKPQAPISVEFADVTVTITRTR